MEETTDIYVIPTCEPKGDFLYHLVIIKIEKEDHKIPQNMKDNSGEKGQDQMLLFRKT